MPPLPRSFYSRDTRAVAIDLLGKRLVRSVDGHLHEGRIVETEAYLGIGDLASHAARGLTARTASTWGRPGLAYVYRIYGIYWCLNAVTLEREPYGAVLIRAIELSQPRCCKKRFLPEDAAGPGRLCRTLQVDGNLNGEALDGPRISIEDGPAPRKIACGPRIGIRHAARRLLRFADAESPWVSRPRPTRRLPSAPATTDKDGAHKGDRDGGESRAR